MSHSLTLPFFKWNIATVTKPSERILGSDREQRLSNRFLECLSCSRPSPSQERLDFGEGLFNRREIGRISGKKEQLTASILNQLLHACSLVGPSIVHDDELSGRQIRDKHLFDIRFKSGGIGRSFHDHRRTYPLQRQGSDQGGVLATIARHAASGSFSFGGSCLQRGQSDVGATFIQKDQLLHLHFAHLLTPVDSFLLIAFAGCQRLFFRVQSTRLMASLIAQRLTRTPWLCSHSSQCRCSVTSGYACSCSTTPACSAANFLGVRPGMALALT